MPCRPTSLALLLHLSICPKASSALFFPHILSFKLLRSILFFGGGRVLTRTPVLTLEDAAHEKKIPEEEKMFFIINVLPKAALPKADTSQCLG